MPVPSRSIRGRASRARPAAERIGGVCRMSSLWRVSRRCITRIVTPKLLPGSAARNRGWGEGTCFRAVCGLLDRSSGLSGEKGVSAAHVGGALPGSERQRASRNHGRRPISPRPPRRLELRSPRPHRGRAPVAQRIEHLTTDQKVGGSNPYRRASHQPQADPDLRFRLFRKSWRSARRVPTLRTPVGRWHTEGTSSGPRVSCKVAGGVPPSPHARASAPKPPGLLGHVRCVEVGCQQAWAASSG